MVLEDDYQSLTKIDKLSKAYDSAKRHIQLKAENDPLMRDNEIS